MRETINDNEQEKFWYDRFKSNRFSSIFKFDATRRKWKRISLMKFLFIFLNVRNELLILRHFSFSMSRSNLCKTLISRTFIHWNEFCFSQFDLWVEFSRDFFSLKLKKLTIKQTICFVTRSFSFNYRRHTICYDRFFDLNIFKEMKWKRRRKAKWN